MKRGRRKVVDTAQATRYHQVATALWKSARDLQELAILGDTYGNAISIVAVHAAIAYSDALTIAFAGYKSAEGEHLMVVDALHDALGARADARMLKLLRSILLRKDTVSYQGDYYTVEESRQIVDHLQGFAGWAEALLARRP